MVTICFDFDGVLAAYKEWGDGGIGLPLPAGVHLLKLCRQAGYETVLSTCRVHPQYGKKAALEQHEKIIKWLDDAGLSTYINRIENQGKPIADFYIDDRGLHFDQEKAHESSYAETLFSIIKQKETRI